jgi:hypothetical protein
MKKDATESLKSWPTACTKWMTRTPQHVFSPHEHIVFNHTRVQRKCYSCNQDYLLYKNPACKVVKTLSKQNHLFMTLAAIYSISSLTLQECPCLMISWPFWCIQPHIKTVFGIHGYDIKTLESYKHNLQ